MIKIKAVYIGDATESFVERNFSDGINVIYSMDNNRGKTVLMQGIMYTLGALPTFPSSFPYRDYIYIADLNINNKNISILRYKNSFAVKTMVDLIYLKALPNFQNIGIRQSVLFPIS